MAPQQRPTIPPVLSPNAPTTNPDCQVIYSAFASLFSNSDATSDCCNQDSRVVCNTNNRVIELNLSSQRLDGSIPTSLSDLTSLEVLDLSGNRLTGTIPGNLAGLRELRVLNLSNNELVGTIPPNLSGELILGGNCLTARPWA
ncbi:hypothetical protein HDV05_002175 [Chytridiales sp. JEL 0842]|nr:hypothetical protein HDV05_002175 [Chytridiales sp. JEL 0842]